jgi:hypothetical protein
MAVSVVIRRQLGFDIGQGDVTADPDIHALCHLRDVQIEVGHRDVEPVLLILTQ